MAEIRTPLEVVRAELALPPAPEVLALAEAAVARMGGPSVIAGVLYYGSCLRDGVFEDRLVDLYLIAESYEAVHGRGIMAFLNTVLPPNVYYVETDHEGRRLRAKFALLSLRQLGNRVRPWVLNPYFWARFAQPMGLVATRDETVRQRIEWALARSVETLFRMVLPLYKERPKTAEAFWLRAFTETYRTELRVEKPDRPRQIFAHYQARFETLFEWGRYLEPHETRRHALWRWRLRRAQGKLLSVLRLLKAAYTFTDGADYLAYKIERHSGVKLEVTPWRRRHPVLAAWPLLVRLLLKRAVR
ncbi:MAG: hypothetical protein KDG89_06850 [Geminicoccaceae bacterium]|nr:hypothetical protein [Geminicoccaceae bacterium]